MGDLKFWLNKHGLGKIVPMIKNQNIAAVVNESHALNRFILNGCGVGFCFDSLMQKELEEGKLIRLFPELEPIFITVDIARRKVHTPNLLLDTFLEFVGVKQ